MLLYCFLVYKSRGAFCACGLRISTSLARFCSLIVAISVAPFAAAKRANAQTADKLCLERSR